MKIGVQSGYVFTKDAYADGLRMIREAGFESVDINLDEMLNVKKLAAEGANPFFSRSTGEIEVLFVPMKEQADVLGLSFGQMHAPFPVYLPGKDDANDALFDAICKCMAVCRVLDCPNLIVHPIAWDGTIAEERERNMAFYSALIETAKRYDVCICLENMFHGRYGYMTEAVCSDFAAAAEYIDALNAIAGEERFGFCYDVGHATLLGKDQRRSINQLGKRLKALHIHDNDGRNDLHMQPYAYTRGQQYVTDWNGFLQGLRDVGFDGVLSFETYHSLMYLPETLKGAMLRYIAQVGSYFRDQLTGS
ncbi:MAG: sugar phosphate isomerase/epimerase [Clostridia bacterium]|nr:sugar phosphate isomerase/epimerase [Clostridia bacterium]